MANGLRDRNSSEVAFERGRQKRCVFAANFLWGERVGGRNFAQPTGGHPPNAAGRLRGQGDRGTGFPSGGHEESFRGAVAAPRTGAGQV